jgi:hypothetical protein
MYEYTCLSVNLPTCSRSHADHREAHATAFAALGRMRAEAEAVQEFQKVMRIVGESEKTQASPLVWVKLPRYAAVRGRVHGGHGARGTRPACIQNGKFSVIARTVINWTLRIERLLREKNTPLNF